MSPSTGLVDKGQSPESRQKNGTLLHSYLVAAIVYPGISSPTRDLLCQVALLAIQPVATSVVPELNRIGDIGVFRQNVTGPNRQAWPNMLAA